MARSMRRSVAVMKPKGAEPGFAGRYPSLGVRFSFPDRTLAADPVEVRAEEASGASSWTPQR
jgi:hypothetical protein